MEIYFFFRKLINKKQKRLKFKNKKIKLRMSEIVPSPDNEREKEQVKKNKIKRRSCFHNNKQQPYDYER